MWINASAARSITKLETRLSLDEQRNLADYNKRLATFLSNVSAIIASRASTGCEWGEITVLSGDYDLLAEGLDKIHACGFKTELEDLNFYRNLWIGW